MPELPAIPTGLSPVEWIAIALVIAIIADRVFAGRERRGGLERLEACIDRVEASRELETADRAALIQALADKAASDAAMASECHAGQQRSAEALHSFDAAMRSMERVAQDLRSTSDNLRVQCIAHREYTKETP